MRILVFLVLFGAWAISSEFSSVGSTGRVGSIYWTTCSGSGPSLDFARKQAIDQCKLSAADQLEINLRVDTLVVNTEKGSGLHEEIKSTKSIANLICEPGKEQLKESAGFYEILLECKFDLSKAKVSLEKMDDKPNSPSAIVASKRRIVIASVPKCESILVVSSRSNIIKCSSNPMAVVLEPGTKEVIVRAEHYKPYRVSKQLEDIKNAYLQIMLEPL